MMTQPNPVSILEEKYGIDVNSIRGILVAAEEVESKGLTDEKILSRLKELSGEDSPELKTSPQIKMTYKYFIQNVIRDNINNNPIDAVQSLNNAITNADDFIKNNPWAFAEGNESTTANSNKKQTKQDRAEQLFLENEKLDRQEMYELFMKELDMSIAGARTYYRNLRKKLS